MNIWQRFKDWWQHEGTYRRLYIETRSYALSELTLNARLMAALAAIAACETPRANATVKRMARIAREALE